MVGLENAGFRPYVNVARSPLSQRIAIIGGGWAGMAAAVQLQTQGHQITIWEASRTWGGRARALALPSPCGQTWIVDNGQHILIGAYQTCLQVMRSVGIDCDSALLRLPLDLRYTDGTGLRLPNLPPPWDAISGIAITKGWSWSEKIALLRIADRWKRSDFVCSPHATVADLCKGLPQRLIQDFVDPLCISALNLPAHEASGAIFLRVLQDGLFSGKGGSNLLMPLTDLSTLFPATAANWLEVHGAQLHLGARVQNIAWDEEFHTWQVEGQVFDTLILATASSEAARLLTRARLTPQIQTSAVAWAECAQALPHTAIATVYAHSQRIRSNNSLLPAPMVALRSNTHAPAQFAFDKAQLGGPKGLVALVVSACDKEKEILQTQVLKQAREQLDLPDLQALKTIIDKRATFSCTPHVQRPTAKIAPKLWACGDYVAGPYPATLEGAVRSGLHVAQALEQQR